MDNVVNSENHVLVLDLREVQGVTREGKKVTILRDDEIVALNKQGSIEPAYVSISRNQTFNFLDEEKARHAFQNIEYGIRVASENSRNHAVVRIS